MSQKKEKYARSLERRIYHLEVCDVCHDAREARFEHILNAIQAKDTADYAAKIRKSRENMRRAMTETRKWRRGRMAGRRSADAVHGTMLDNQGQGRRGTTRNGDSRHAGEGRPSPRGIRKRSH